MLKLTPEQNALFMLLRGEHVQALHPDWKLLMNEAVAQSVFSLLPDSLDLPAKDAAEWQKMRYASYASNMSSYYALLETDRVMRDANQRYVILKGLAAAYYYPDPLQRALGDVDFLIDPVHQSEVEQALEAEGYERSSYSHYCHVAFHKEDQDLEMHFQIPGIPDGAPGDIVREYIHGILDETISYEIEGNIIQLPLPEYHGLILLLHMQHHMVSQGIGLRHLMDWCYFIQETDQDAFWQTDLLPVLKEIGLLHFAQILTKTGAIYLHTPCPDWAQAADESVCDVLMEDILTGGNFGRKNSARSQSRLFFSDGHSDLNHGSFYYMWQNLLGSVRAYFPIVKKHPILYPVFIPVRACTMLWAVATGKRSSLLRSAAYVRTRKALYQELHLFEVKK